MEFKKYPSLENHYRDKFINAIEMNIPSDALWVATEKMHGANLGIWYDGNEVEFSRRTDFIKQGEKFYQLSLIRDSLEERIKALYHDCGFEGVLTLYGELVGEGVQKGVNYTEGNKFFVFDAMHNYQFLVWPGGMSQVLRAYEFDLVPEIARGTFQEMMALENDFNSKVKAGLQDFTAEGLVIKPVDPKYRYLPNGSQALVKSKNSKFSEFSKAPKSKPHRVVDSPVVKEWVDAVYPYITENRVHAVISKEGPYERSMFGKIMNLTVLDALEEYCKDSEKDLNLLDKQDRKDIMGLLVYPAREILKKL